MINWNAVQFWKHTNVVQITSSSLQPEWEPAEGARHHTNNRCCCAGIFSSSPMPPRRITYCLERQVSIRVACARAMSVKEKISRNNHPETKSILENGTGPPWKENKMEYYRILIFFKIFFGLKRKFISQMHKRIPIELLNLRSMNAFL